MVIIIIIIMIMSVFQRGFVLAGDQIFGFSPIHQFGILLLRSILSPSLTVTLIGMMMMIKITMVMMMMMGMNKRMTMVILISLMVKVEDDDMVLKEGVDKRCVDRGGLYSLSCTKG